MLGTRSIRFAAIRCVRPVQCVRSSNLRTRMLQPTAMMRPSLAGAYSKDAKTAETTLKSNNFDNISSALSSSTSITKFSSPSKSKVVDEIKSESKECSTGTFGEAGIKLPSKDQVEGFVFKSMVYFWDFVYYLFCLSRKLFEKYVVNNSSVQQYWKRFQTRMENARKELKPK